MSLREYLRALIVEKTKYKEMGQDFDPKDRVLGYANDPYVFVHFSNINKLGVNPRSNFKTPLGIYGYPVNQFDIDALLTGKVPFAGDREFIHFFAVKPEHRDCVVFIDADGKSNKDEEFQKIVSQTKSNVGNKVSDQIKKKFANLVKDLEFESMLYARDKIDQMLGHGAPKKEYDKALEDFLSSKEYKMVHYYELADAVQKAETFADIPMQLLKKCEEDDAIAYELGDSALQKDFINACMSLVSQIDASGEDSSRFKTGVGFFWNMTRLASGDMKKWRSMLVNKFGICGFVDYGAGLIHPSEPKQAVFFSMGYIEQIATLPNRRQETSIMDRKRENIKKFFNKKKKSNRFDVHKIDDDNVVEVHLLIRMATDLGDKPLYLYDTKGIESAAKTLSKKLGSNEKIENSNIKFEIDDYGDDIVYVTVPIFIDLRNQEGYKKLRHLMSLEQDNSHWEKRIKSLIKQ